MRYKSKQFIVIILLFFIVGCSDNSEEISNLNLEISNLKETIEIKDNEIIELKAENLELQNIVQQAKPWLDLTLEQQKIILEAINNVNFEIENYAKDSYNFNHFDRPLKLYSDDGEMVFLGEVTSNEYASDSIFNEYGTYGNEYNSNSIWNTFGTYGSKYSSYSAFNPYASNPPIIIDSNFSIVGRLTENKFAKDAISPYDIKLMLEKLGL